MIALDTSVLAYAINRHTPEHPRAAAVVEELVNGDLPWALPWPVVHEFLRLVVHAHTVAHPLGVAEAAGFAHQITASPALRMLAPTERHGQVIDEVLALLPAGAGIPAGFETAVLLREHGVRELLSADWGMRRFAFLSVRDPLHGAPGAPQAPPLRRHRVLAPRAPRARQG